jgi:putative transposase
MARKQRHLLAGYPHHIVQRGHNQQTVFAQDGDRLAYLSTLREFRAELHLKLYGYCLMTNHVHLIVDPGDGPHRLSLLMKRLAGRHTRRVNCLLQRTGTAWSGRFKCSPIETDRYLLACTRYVDLNPVRAGIVPEPQLYPWSSYRAHIGMTPCEWLDPDPCYLGLAATPSLRQQRYREFVEQGSGKQELRVIRQALSANQLTGATPTPRGRPKKGSDLFSATPPPAVSPPLAEAENRSDPFS